MRTTNRLIATVFLMGVAGQQEGTAGAEYCLRANSELVFAATSKAALDRLGQFLAADDDLGVKQLLSSGVVFRVPSGTPCNPISRDGWWSREVRVLEGKHAGKLVWVSVEHVRSIGVPTKPTTRKPEQWTAWLWRFLVVCVLIAAVQYGVGAYKDQAISASSAKPWIASGDAQPWTCPKCAATNSAHEFSCTSCSYQLM